MDQHDLVTTSRTSIRVTSDRVIVTDVRGTATFPAERSTMHTHSYHAGPVGTAKVVEFADQTGRSKWVATGFMSKTDRSTLLERAGSVLTADAATRRTPADE